MRVGPGLGADEDGVPGPAWTVTPPVEECELEPDGVLWVGAGFAGDEVTEADVDGVELSGADEAGVDAGGEITGLDCTTGLDGVTELGGTVREMLAECLARTVDVA